MNREHYMYSVAIMSIVDIVYSISIVIDLTVLAIQNFEQLLG